MHQIRYVDNVITYDIVWIVTGSLMIIVGYLMSRKREMISMIILNSLPIVIIALSLIGSYIGMALKERSWPFYRTCLWVIGVL